MGTTLIAMLRAGDKIVLAHIGDSRAFMVRDGVVTQITKDHSFVQNLVDEGRITADEAQTHPQRSLVTRVLTGAHDDEPDLVVRQGRIGDRYVIASDGLTDYVARDTIHEVLTTTADPGETADRLVALALRAGAPDNVTVVVGDLVDIAHHPAPPTQPQVVGAAAARQTGTRPIPTTPAAKAAALTAQATRAVATPTTGVTLAEEGPRSRRGTVLRAGRPARRARRRRGRQLVRRCTRGPSSSTTSPSRTAWSPCSAGSTRTSARSRCRAPSTPPRSPSTTCRPPTRTACAQGIEVDDRAAADARVAELRLQAQACRWAQLNGEVCRTVPSTWTDADPHAQPHRRTRVTPGPRRASPTGAHESPRRHRATTHR